MYMTYTKLSLRKSPGSLIAFDFQLQLDKKKSIITNKEMFLSTVNMILFRKKKWFQHNYY